MDTQILPRDPIPGCSSPSPRPAVAVFLTRAPMEPTSVSHLHPQRDAPSPRARHPGGESNGVTSQWLQRRGEHGPQQPPPPRLDSDADTDVSAGTGCRAPSPRRHGERGSRAHQPWRLFPEASRRTRKPHPQAAVQPSPRGPDAFGGGADPLSRRCAMSSSVASPLSLFPNRIAERTENDEWTPFVIVYLNGFGA